MMWRAAVGLCVTFFQAFYPLVTLLDWSCYTSLANSDVSGFDLNRFPVDSFTSRPGLWVIHRLGEKHPLQLEGEQIWG